jgi:N-methylhydantoinase B
MTNTRNTPVEILEQSYPFTIEEYALVEDSPGAGCWRGGAGVRRRYLLNSPATVTLSSDRSRNPPWGLAGGEPGRVAQNYRVLPGGRQVPLPSKASWRALAGERVVIETPGGGGYGDSRQRDGKLIARDRAEELLSADYIDRYYREGDTDQL